jgi:tetratricopeptide (TPR) repeat protein
MVLLVWLASAWAATAVAQSPELHALHTRVIQLYASGHTVEAVVVAEQALDLATVELGRGHASTAALAFNLARLHGELEQWGQAEDLYRRAAVVRSETLGDSDPETGAAHAGLAESLAKQARYEEAEQSYWQALETLAVEAARNPHVANRLNLLAGLYRAQAIYNRAHQFVVEARLVDADLMYLSAIAVFEANDSVDRTVVVAALGRRAAVLRTLGRDDEAAAVETHAAAVDRGRASCPKALRAAC